MNWEEKFIQGVFSEPDGKPSFSRCVVGTAVAFSLGWVTAIVVHNTRHNLSPILPDFSGIVMFISTLYGINKITSLFITKGDNDGQRREENPR